MIEYMSPAAPVAQEALRAYYTDIVSRYYGRQATDAEIDSAMAAEPNDDLELWVAVEGGAVLGCAGLRRGDGIGVVKRVFVDTRARRRGIASRLLNAVEDAARGHGLTRLQLDTRHDLVEARALYLKLGFREVPAFNDDKYAEHWFAKDLAQ